MFRLQSLRRGAERHDHIVLSYAVFNTTEEKSIFFPWAELGDLTSLLYGETGEDYRRPLPLLIQASRLAGALRWLHQPISGRRECIAHMDFKPRNILRFDSSESIVGTWKLSDFGVAITDVRPGKTPTAIWDWLKYPEQAVQEYNAPELVPLIKTTSINPEITLALLKADVWSFACVLLEILVFAKDGSEKVNGLSDARWNGHPDYTDGRYYFDLQGEKALKTSIREWMDQVDLDDTTWVGQCRDIIQKALIVEPAKRQSIVEVERELDRIVESLSPEEPRELERQLSSSGTSARSVAVTSRKSSAEIVAPSAPPNQAPRPRQESDHARNPSVQQTPTLQQPSTFQHTSIYQHTSIFQQSPTFQEMPTFQRIPRSPQIPAFQQTSALQQTPSLISPHHLSPASSSPPSTRSRSGSPPTPFAKHLRKSSQTIGRDQIPKHTRHEVIDVAFNHDAKMIAFLIRQTRLPTAMLSRQRPEAETYLVRIWKLHLTQAKYTELDTIHITDHKGSWKHVVLAYPFLCVWGVSGQRKNVSYNNSGFERIAHNSYSCRSRFVTCETAPRT